MPMHMFREDDIHALLKNRQLKSPVVSIYLNTDRGSAAGRSIDVSLQHLEKDALTMLHRDLTPESEAAREILKERVMPQIREFLEREVMTVPAIRGVAAFASLAGGVSGTHMVTIYTLPRPVRSNVFIDLHPVVRPLLLLLDQYERYAVIAVDRKRARFFTVFLGELEEHEELTSDTPQRTSQGGWAQGRFQRHVDDHIDRHVGAIVERAEKILASLPTHRILLGGDADMIPRLRDALSTPLAERVVGKFRLDVHGSIHEIRERTLAAAREVEAAEETKVVQALRDAAAHRGGYGVTGLERTLAALTRRDVRTLVVQIGFESPGSVCPNCLALLPPTPLCPHCRARTAPTHDIVEHAIERAETERAHIEFVEDDTDLMALGHIGAILRFPVEAG